MALKMQEIDEGDTAVLEPPVAVAPPPARRIAKPHRVSVVDIDEIGGWLVSRLRERFPKHNDRVLFSWLRGCTNDNETFFSRDGGGVAMATVHRSFLSPPWVEEVFCFAQTEDDKWRATGLYTDIRTWALGLGATHIIVERCTDIERADISLEIGTPKREVRSVVYLPGHQP